jgi:hypothetical protein
MKLLFGCTHYLERRKLIMANCNAVSKNNDGNRTGYKGFLQYRENALYSVADNEHRECQRYCITRNNDLLPLQPGQSPNTPVIAMAGLIIILRNRRSKSFRPFPEKAESGIPMPARI